MATYLVLLFPVVGFVGVGLLVRGILRFEQRYHHGDPVVLDLVDSERERVEVSELVSR